MLGNGGLARVALLLCIVQFIDAWLTHGVLPSAFGSTSETDPRSHGSSVALYAGKFCFDYSKDQDAGTVAFHVDGKAALNETKTAHLDGQGLYLLIFDDEESHWEKVDKSWDTNTCQEFMRYASAKYTITDGKILLQGPTSWTVRISQKIRPRWWYFVILGCSVSMDGPVTYSIHAQNPLQGFQSEFSVDESGAFFLYPIAAIIFGSLATTLLLTARYGYGMGAFRSRPLLKLLLLACLFSIAGCLCMFVHFAIYASNGQGSGALEVLGELMGGISKAMLTLLQLFVVKGRALFRAPEEQTRRSVALCLLCSIVLVSLGCEIYGRYFANIDWSTTLYFYASWPGTIKFVLYALLFAEICRTSLATYKQEVSKDIRRFYAATFTVSFLHFVAFPLVCILAYLFDPWSRKKYVARTEIIMRLGVAVLLAICLRPSRLDEVINARLANDSSQRAQGLELVQSMTRDTKMRWGLSSDSSDQPLSS